MKSALNKTWLQVLIIVLITVSVYINVIDNDFVWDDKTFILNWEEKKDIKNIPDLLKGDVPEGHEGVYRPLRSLFYVASYRIFGVSKTAYHLFSIFIHLCATLLVYFILKNISNKNIGFLSSLIFGMHPIHTEAISYATSSFDIIGIVFLFLSFLFYVYFSKNKKIANYLFSIVFALFTAFTFEMAVILPLLIILYDMCVKKLSFDGFRKKIKIYSPYFVIVFVYLFIRFFVLRIIARGSYLGNSFYHTMLTMSKAFLKYILLVIFPFSLTTDHTVSDGIMSLTYSGYDKEKILAQSFFDTHVLLSAAIIFLLIYIGFKFYRKNSLVTFCIGWFFISLLPVSNVIFIGSVMSEKYLYLASFGFCFLLGYTIYRIRNYKYIPVILMLAVLSFYSTTTVIRNNDWQNDFSLWSATIEKSPESSVAYYNMGNYYYRQSNYDMAIISYKTAIILNPVYLKAYNNLGLVFIDSGRLDDAEKLFRLLVEAKPDYENAYNNLGIIYVNRGEYTLAREMFIKAIEINPEFEPAKDNLAKVDLLVGDE